LKKLEKKKAETQKKRKGTNREGSVESLSEKDGHHMRQGETGSARKTAGKLSMMWGGQNAARLHLQNAKDSPRKKAWESPQREDVSQQECVIRVILWRQKTFLGNGGPAKRPERFAAGRALTCVGSKRSSKLCLAGGKEENAEKKNSKQKTERNCVA